MKSGAIAWIIGLVVAGGALAMVANRADSPEEREAKLQYEQSKDAIADRREEIKDETRAKKDELAEATKARKADIKDDASRALDSAEDKAERVEENLEDRAEQTQQNLDRKLDAAKDEFKLSKEASEGLDARRDAAEREADRDADRVAGADREAADVDADEVSGTVTAINPNTRTVSIREELSSSPTQPFRSPTQLNVDANAKVEHAGQRLSLSDVQAGDQVNLSVRDTSGQRSVTMIVITQRAGVAR